MEEALTRPFWAFPMQCTRNRTCSVASALTDILAVVIVEEGCFEVMGKWE
jgi:hypothetical protein